MWVVIARSLFVCAAFAAAGWFVHANFQPGKFQRMGHVLDDDFIGHQVFGSEYGWPLVYATKADRPKYSSLNHYWYGHLAANVGLGLFAVLSILALGECLIYANRDHK